ncbi:MAG: hypothetical protein DMG67_06045, partial [Acidobacteria bacterium]
MAWTIARKRCRLRGGGKQRWKSNVNRRQFISQAAVAGSALLLAEDGN